MSSELKLSNKDRNGTIIIENPQTETISLHISLNEQSNSNTDKNSSAPKKELTKDERKIFISCVKEDLKIGRQLYNDLKLTRLTPWLAEKDLLAGQNKEMTINDQIDKTDYFLVLLSPKSVNKGSSVIRELNIAFNKLHSFLFNDIFIIPLYLDKFEYNDPRLKKLQGISLLSSYEDYEESLKKIFQAIEAQEDPSKKFSEVQENSDKKNRPKER